MEEGQHPVDEMQAGLFLGRTGREDFEFRGCTKRDYALVRPAERDTAVGSGLDPVIGMKHGLVELGDAAGSVTGTGGNDEDITLNAVDANLVGGRWGGGGSGIGQIVEEASTTPKDKKRDQRNNAAQIANIGFKRSRSFPPDSNDKYA